MSNKILRCKVCGKLIEEEFMSATCPICGASSDDFQEVKNQNPVIIIGNGAAGIAAAENIRMKNQDVEILIITVEEEKAYYRPILSHYLSKEISNKELYLKDEQWYIDKNIKVLYNAKVKEIIPKNKEIILENQEKRSYESLILANGSSSFVPPIDGKDKKGVFVLRSKQDADNIKEYIKASKKIVILGGGILGLEAAWEFGEMGYSVEVVELEKRLFPRQLDDEGSAIMEKIIDNSHIKVHKGVAVKKIEGTDKINAVVLDDGEILEADMVLISAGIRPNIDLVEGTGIKCNRGIIVDDRMETSIKGIFASGDVAEHNGLVTGLWVTAVRQGGIAGANSIGGEKEFKASPSAVTFSGWHIKLFSIGDIGHNTKQVYKSTAYTDIKNKIYKKVYFVEDKFVGGILMGDTSKSNELLNALRLGTNMADLTNKIM